MKFKLPKIESKKTNPFEDVHEIRKHIRNRDAMLMDFYMHDNKVYSLKKEWSNLPNEWIYQQGYLLGDKFQTELKYYGCKTFVRFHNWKICDASAHNNFLTSATLYDYLKSDTSSRFISGMTKISFAPIDLKMIILAIPVIVGIIIGMVYFMGGH